jgi:endonuclease/exonuclease/phosphatase (EEP) superfamily protein YafD
VTDTIIQYPTRPVGGARRWFVRALDLSLAFGTLGLLAATLAPFLHLFWPRAAIAENFALQILICAALLSVLALVQRRRWLIGTFAVLIIQAVTIHPYWPHLADNRAIAAAPIVEAPGGLKVVSLNVWAGNTSYDEVQRYLTATDADIIGLVEVSPRWQGTTAALTERYPYRVACQQGWSCRQILLSRYPFARQGVIPIEDSLSFLSWGEIRLPGPDGQRPVTIALTHLTRPFHEGPQDRAGLPDDVPNLTQAIEAQHLADHLRQLGPDLVLMGDFNAAPWTRIQQRLRRDSGLNNAGAPAPSWPNWAPVLLRLPIDHILSRGALQVSGVDAGPDVGSDHRPVEAILGFAPTAALP